MRRASALLVLLLVVAAAAAGCGSKDRPPSKGAEYVALGDSYTAGPGMEPVADKSCRRSKINYPSLVDKALKIKSFADRSCGGARTGNLEERQTFPNPATHQPVKVNEPQLNAVGKNTKLVTIGMGLNDGAIATGLLLICNVIPPKTEPSDTCKQYLEQPQSAIDAQIKGAAADVQAALETIAKKAPDARIVVVGYPRVAPDRGSCPDLLPVPDAQLVRLRESLKVANEAWSEAAQEAGASYVDMYTLSEGHDICSDDPWMSGYRGVPGKAAGLHPFPEYAQAVADQVVALVKSD
jgi:hypothetical protein